MKTRHFYLVVLGVLLLLLISYGLSPAQCAMCRANAESSLKNDAGGSIARGLNKGILYLMAIPYLLLAFIFRHQLKTLWNKYVGPKLRTRLP